MAAPPDRNAIDVEIGRRIRELRIDRQLTAEEVAEALGVSSELYMSHEEGRGRFSAEQLFQLATRLKVELSDIFDGFDDKR